jgi:two-component system sensor histidine kinase CiaH
VNLRRLSVASLGRVRSIRPGLGPLRRLRRAFAPPADEDARILRTTRLRLMLVSGGLTLVILVILGAALYSVVASAVEGGAVDRLKRVALEEPSNAQGIDIQGDSAGLLLILVPPSGTPQGPGQLPLPAGLPNQASLDAVKQQGEIDIRSFTAPDGTPYRVISGYVNSRRFPGWKGQWVQNRSVEVGFLNDLGLILLGGGGAALLVAVLFGYLYAGRALVPIRQSMGRRQAALQRQREFTANASHELRTPLTVIRTSVEDLKRNRHRRVEDVGEALDDIDSEVRQVTALVEDMLLLARTDSTVVQVEKVELDLADVAAEAASLLTAMAKEHDVILTLDPFPASVLGDPLRLRQLVTILVDNAIRHSPGGSTVIVRVHPELGAAILEVEDQGPGIKAEDLPRLWERFWRADDAPVGGTGLGLAIAKWIVDQHGGTIAAENCPEGGARFTVRLPAAGPPSFMPEIQPGPETWPDPAAQGHHA